MPSSNTHTHTVRPGTTGFPTSRLVTGPNEWARRDVKEPHFFTLHTPLVKRLWRDVLVNGQMLLRWTEVLTERDYLTTPSTTPNSPSSSSQRRTHPPSLTQFRHAVYPSYLHTSVAAIPHGRPDLVGGFTHAQHQRRLRDHVRKRLPDTAQHAQALRVPSPVVPNTTLQSFHWKGRHVVGTQRHTTSVHLGRGCVCATFPRTHRSEPCSAPHRYVPVSKLCAYTSKPEPATKSILSSCPQKSGVRHSTSTDGFSAFKCRTVAAKWPEPRSGCPPPTPPPRHAKPVSLRGTTPRSRRHKGYHAHSTLPHTRAPIAYQVVPVHAG